MSVTVKDYPVTPETLAAASMGGEITLAEPRRNARRHVRLYHAKDGTPFVRDRLHGRRDVVAIRFLHIDGERLNCGCAVLGGAK